MSSFRSPYASVAAAGLRRHGRSPVRAALDQQGPDDAGHLVGQGGGDQHARLAREHPRPVVRPATSLQRHKTGWLPREKLEHLGPHQALAEHHPAGRIGPMRLKYPLRNIKPYRASLAHGRLPWWLLNTTTLAHRCRRGASTPSRWQPSYWSSMRAVMQFPFGYCPECSGSTGSGQPPDHHYASAENRAVDSFRWDRCYQRTTGRRC